MSDEHKGKKHKPGKNHPWKNGPSSKAIKWAKEQTSNTFVNNYKRGGGLPPWNGDK